MGINKNVKARFEKKVFYHDDVELPYMIYLPKNYNENKKYPVLFFLHGDGLNNRSLDDLIDCLEAITIKRAVIEYEKVIIVAPIAKQSWVLNINDANLIRPRKSYLINELNQSKYLIAADNLLNNICQNYAVDESRIYLNGYSRGCMASFYLLNKYPNRFKACSLCCGASPRDINHILKEIPIMFFHGDQDELVSYQDNKDLFAEINRLGGKCVFVTGKNQGHGLEKALLDQEDLISWLFDNK